VLDGVRDLLSERWAEDAALVGKLREWLWAEACCRASWSTARTATTRRRQVPRLLRLRRADPHRAQRTARWRCSAAARRSGWTPSWCSTRSRGAGPALRLAEGRIAAPPGLEPCQRPADDLIRKTVAWTWKVKLSLSLERDLFARLREEAEAVAIKVFADNLRDLLLAAPAGKRVVMGLDPGIRTGVKVAVVSDTGKVLDTATVYPHEPRCDWEGSLHALGRLVATHGVNLIAIGNGTASRETDKLAADLIKRIAQLAPDVKLDKVVVSEAGASVYSASEFASKELPELDVSLRGAVSIARRLQDPLAELVKIDPKSIGVGQYQHDVNQSGLARTLDAVVEDCVNAVGVDLNTASAPLLARVSGLSARRWRRASCAGATPTAPSATASSCWTCPAWARDLRAGGGLPAHPRRRQPAGHDRRAPRDLPVVQKMLATTPSAGERADGPRRRAAHAAARAFADERFGAITVKDILAELEKPGRDPRPDFQVARFNEGVSTSRTCSPAWCWKARSATWRSSAPSSTWACTRTAWCT
jgi:protein Tex